MYVLGPDVEPFNTLANMTEPASSPAVVAVGAACWDGSQQYEQYSSMGPTADGRPKPELTAPDSVATATYGHSGGCGQGFAGTSAAALTSWGRSR